MKNWSVLFFIFFLSITARAQSITGNISTDSTKVALRYGNVDIYKNDKLVASVLTDRLGNFAVALDTGKYVCIINYAGFKSERKEIIVNGDEREDFSMKSDPSAKKPASTSGMEYYYSSDVPTDSKSLSEVTITSEKGYKKTTLLAKSARSDAYSTAPASRTTSSYDGVDKYVAEDVATGSGSGGRARALTAGEINDFSKWELWQKYTKNELNAHQTSWNIAPYGRYTLMLQSRTGLPLADALVKLMVSNKAVFSSRTDNTGKAELWLSIKNDKPVVDGKVSIEVVYNGKTSKISKADAFEKGMNHLMLDVSCQEVENVDVAFVVDATGSMGDEINFLKAEISDIVYQSKAISSKLNFRFANVFYRDLGDAYVTKTMNFNRVLTEATNYIAEQSAGGGGDYEEAVEIALDTAINKLTWSETARTRILFLVLDAPPHNTDANRAKLETLIKQAAEKGIRIVPIGASGINKSTEYLLRAMALGTNGTYTFLTNHSGIGNTHIAPTTDKYDVETLNDVMIRILKSYTYMPDCQQQIPDLALNIPDSIVTNELPAPKDSLDSINRLTKPQPNDQKVIRWSYYPNPTNGIVNIVSDIDIEELYVTDLSGKVLQIIKKIEKGRIHQVDLSQYATGIYLIRYPDGDNWLSGKVVLHRTS